MSKPLSKSNILCSTYEAPSPALYADPITCATVSFVILLFTTQNIGIPVDSIGHGETSHKRICAVTDIIRRVAHLHHHGASGCTPLVGVYSNGKWSNIHSINITKSLRAAVKVVGT